MGFIYLLIVVLGITATALISKLAARRGIGALDLATSLFAISTVLGAAVLYRQPTAPWTSPEILFSTIAGIGGAGAVLAFNRAVREGHFGYSNAIYRSAFLIPVLYAVLFLHAPLHPTTLAGIACILAGIVLMSHSTAAPTAGESRTTPWHWIGLILLAFLFSGAPRVGQTLVHASHGNYYHYLFLSYLVGTVALVAITLPRRRFNPASLTWGTGSAIASYLGVLCTLKALEALTPHIVFPISLSAPIILGVLLSLGMFRERITPRGWLGVTCGVIGILILALCK